MYNKNQSIKYHIFKEIKEATMNISAQLDQLSLLFVKGLKATARDKYN
jgi:hypothetical protein